MHFVLRSGNMVEKIHLRKVPEKLEIFEVAVNIWKMWKFLVNRGAQNIFGDEPPPIHKKIDRNFLKTRVCLWSLTKNIPLIFSIPMFLNIENVLQWEKTDKGARSSDWSGVGRWWGALTSSRDGALGEGGGSPGSNPGEEARPRTVCYGGNGNGSYDPCLGRGSGGRDNGGGVICAGRGQRGRSGG